MTQAERRHYLITQLLCERPDGLEFFIPAQEQEQKALLRALLNMRMPKPASREFLKVQNAYLQEEIRQKGITSFSSLQPVQPGIYIWRGDITTLACDAIVNAANRQMLGCFCPNHGCIDNAIHTFAGVQLRFACARMMKRQGRDELPGQAKITPAFNLPSRYVLHTVGPVVCGRPSKADEQLLAGCYRSCLHLAEQNHVKSLAFCCISTGEFHFPNAQAAKIAVQTVKEYQKQTQSEIKVIFNVFQQADDVLYRRLLCTNQSAKSLP